MCYLKYCPTCKVNLTNDKFYKNKSSKDGLSFSCKECKKKIDKKYSNNNKEKIKKYFKERYEIKKLHIISINKNWQDNNREKVIKYGKKWKKENIDKSRANAAAYRKKNRDIIREKSRKYKKERWSLDVNFRIRETLGNQLRSILKLQSVKKCKNTMEFIGCSVEQLKLHLESLFQEGMTWENYGQWHVDHIRPCASFDLTDPEQQKLCFHYTNLQPLWASDNLKKSSLYESVKYYHKK